MVVVVVVVVGTTLARPSNPYAPPPSDVPAEYQFNYGVKDDYYGNEYSHTEDRSGYSSSGQYQVLLSDGRIQTVEYTVTKDGGFQANVVAKGVKTYA
ncbi:pro-resilin-like [Homarus americanus]|uniref:Pro-resilin-like 112 n=1 Tax=Homarus americanus TaxID=6706 RepID=A0A8J5N576_HOMAM|nr:pro-resilin-like [Homarus americanus]KAG7173661.1 Pro-resilin-like 112 [Homarus americanus]